METNNDNRNTVEKNMEKSYRLSSPCCDNNYDNNNPLHNNKNESTTTTATTATAAMNHSDNDNEKSKQEQAVDVSVSVATEDVIKLNRRLQFEETIRVVRQKELELLEQHHEQTKKKKKKNRTIRQGVMNGFHTVGNVLQKVNIAAWIDELEQDQNVADQLEIYNIDLQEEQERKRIVHEAHDACRNAIREHLLSFFHHHHDHDEQYYNNNNNNNNNKDEIDTTMTTTTTTTTSSLLDDDDDDAIVPSYENWIRELHPENINEKTNLLDERYYLIDSDHRIMWNDLIKQKINEIQQQDQQQIKQQQQQEGGIVAKDDHDDNDNDNNCNNKMVQHQEMNDKQLLDVAEKLLATLNSRIVDARHIENN